MLSNVSKFWFTLKLLYNVYTHVYSLYIMFQVRGTSYRCATLDKHVPMTLTVRLEMRFLYCLCNRRRDVRKTLQECSY